jgi:FkbH-like protein
VASPGVDVARSMSEDSSSVSSMEDVDYLVAVTSSFTAEPVRSSLAFWMKRQNLPGRLEFAPFNQVFQQLLDSGSLIAANRHGLNVILLRLEDLLPPAAFEQIESAGGGRTSVEGLDWALYFQKDMVRLAKDLIAVANRSVPCLLLLCPSSPRCLANESLARLFQATEEHLVSILSGTSSIYVVRPSDLFSLYPLKEYYEPQADCWGRIPYTPAMYTALGTMIARRMYALRHPPYKVIVLDCDNTLWKGICGESEDVRDLEIDPNRGKLQDFVIGQHDQGMLLCLCSRNNPEDVLNVFREHPGMRLRLDHILAWRINWEPKSANLNSLAEELRLGLDSFIFVDDDPVVCEEVRLACPAVLVLPIPQDDAKISLWLQQTWAFDHLQATEEDARRTALYRENRYREELQETSASLTEFLRSLNLRIQFEPLTSDSAPRAAQLTQRTNQFNFTTIRHTDKALAELAGSGATECLGVTVSDRFGDYGMVGVILCRGEDESLIVDTMLLSCRALGRGVEHAMVAWLGGRAQELHYPYLRLRFLPTSKNRPAEDFLDSLGCDRQPWRAGGCVYELDSVSAAAIRYEPESGAVG